LHLIANQHDSVLRADTAQFLHEKLWRGDVATFALNRLDNNPSNFAPVEETLENLVLECLQNFCAAGFRCVAVSTAIGVGIRDMFDAAQQSAKALALRGFRSR